MKYLKWIVKIFVKIFFLRQYLLRNIDRNEYSFKGNKIFFSKLGITVDFCLHKFFLESYGLAMSINSVYPGAFFVENNDIFVLVDKCKFLVSSQEEILIIKEVFVEGIYNYLPCNSNDNLLVIDIGMNVGVTSLFFAARDNVSRVFAYEPFKETLERAKANLLLNNFSNKIHTHNFGLSDKEEIVAVEYCEENKGSMGVHGLNDFVEGKDSFKYKKVDIELKDVVKVLAPIISSADEPRIVVKIDCEGSEYAILESLYKSNLLDKVDAILMEWHMKGPSDLIKYLGRSGYDIISFNEKNRDVGMLYAFNRKKMK
jgi:FkbM family methyltransferase